MLGKPKYSLNDEVIFDWDNNEITGKISVVDSYGTFEQNDEVSYDIMVEKSPHFNGEPCLYKHIRESIIRK